MKKSAWIALAIAAVLGSSGYFYLARPFADATQPTKKIIPEEKSSSEKASGSNPSGEKAPEAASTQNVGKNTEQALENMLGLAIKGISLFQGEDGVELWRLKASWAHIAEEGGVVNVDAPVVRYTLGDPALKDYMDVVAEKGLITDNQRHLDLWGNVTVVRGEQTMTGARLKYDAATRRMVFPEGATLNGPASSGFAPRFSWDLAENIMIGEGGVTVVLKARPSDPASGKGGALPNDVAPKVKSGATSQDEATKATSGTAAQKKSSKSSLAAPAQKKPQAARADKAKRTVKKTSAAPDKKRPATTDTKK